MSSDNIRTRRVDDGYFHVERRVVSVLTGRARWEHLGTVTETGPSYRDLGAWRAFVPTETITESQTSYHPRKRDAVAAVVELAAGEGA